VNEMNNQAAQTMPELPKPFQKAVIANRSNTMAVRQGYEAGGYEKSPDLYTADQTHQYARDYAAALSQTAGVVEGWKLVPVEPTPEMLAAWRGAQPKGYGTGLSVKAGYRAMLAAAPPASGGEYPGCSGDPASCPENEGHGCCKPNPARHVAIVCDWKNADPFPTFIEAEIGGKSVSLEWRDRPDGLKELIVPVTAAPQPPSAASVSERARDE